MAEEKFDVIIIGGGIAGTVSAYLLASEGLEVLLIERGNYCGSKNMTGGRIYTSNLEEIFPDFLQEAPFERKVTHEKISLMTEDSNFTIDYTSPKLGLPGSDSYTILRGIFDQWLAEKAEEAGAGIITGIRVDDLIMRDGKVCGVIAGEDELESEIVILADGVNSLLAEKIGFRKPLNPKEVAVGAKEVIELPANVIEDRFQLQTDEGAAWLFAGYPSGGKFGGGIIYTNKDSISIGVISTLSELVKGEKPISQLLEDFKNHPAIQPLIKEGRLLEYSGHLVPEGGYQMIPKIIGNGVLVVGDAAGFCINIGFIVRGMDLAVESARCAAKAVLKAIKTKDFSERGLSSYQELLDESFVMKDMKLYQKFPQFLDRTPRIFKGYPEMVDEIMQDMFIINGEPAEPLLKSIKKDVKKVGVTTIAKDALRGVRSL
jgi:electron transfer flavoprotein-quinone oxidoreductase